MRKSMVGSMVVFLSVAAQSHGWSDEGHELITDAAVELLPPDAPGFLKTPEARERLRYLSVEPDRWRNTELEPMGQLNKPDHYLDVETLSLYDLTPATLPKRRNEFIAYIARYKAAHPEKNYHYDPAKDPEGDKELPGLLPYRICEMYVVLRSSFSTLKTYEKYADRVAPGELSSARENILHAMGIMSHYVGDASQPLHTTKHHNGWVGPNPNQYTTSPKFHSRIDFDAVRNARLTFGDVVKRRGPRPEIDESKLFDQALGFVLGTHEQVEPLYRLEKLDAFSADSEARRQGTEFIADRLAASTAMLAALWESAYRRAEIDDFRENLLRRRPLSRPVPANPELRRPAP